MNVLFVSECYPSKEKKYYCIYLEQQAIALKKRGVDVEILVPYVTDENLLGITSEMLNGIHVMRMACHYSKGKARAFIQPYSCNLKAIQWNKYDVVSFHLCSTFLEKMVMNECKGAKVKTAKHIHGVNVWREQCKINGFIRNIHNRIEKWICKRNYSQMDAIICVSELAKTVVEQKLRTVPTYVVYNGVDINKFVPQIQKHNSVFTVLCVANFIEIKGQKYLVDAVAKEVTDGIPIRLQLIGVGKDIDAIKQQCAKLDIEENVEFLGAKDYPDVANYMRMADLFIMPSYAESFGCVYLESMSSGTVTCACYDNKGATEFIRNRENGFLVKGQNSDDIKRVIDFVMSNPEESKVIAESGVKTAAKFTWANSAEKLESVYKKIICNDKEEK